MDIEPVKASLVADLVALVNTNTGVLMTTTIVTCPDCRGAGIVRSVVHGDLTCATCGGAAAIERYDINRELLREPRFGRLIEQFDYKQGQYVPKFRSKDGAYRLLVRMLGLEKAIVEIANGAVLSETISASERETYIAHLKELAAMGLLDGNR